MWRYLNRQYEFSGTEISQMKTSNSVVKRMKASDWLKKLPATMDRGKALLDWLTEKQIPQVYELIQLVAKNAVGISSEEFGNEDEFNHFMKSVIKNKFAFGGTDIQSGQLAAFMMGYPCPFTRSQSPAVLGGYSMVHPDYTGKKMMWDCYQFYMARAVQLGYLGTDSRACVENPASYITRLRFGMKATGTIPSSFKSPTKGWSDDLVEHLDLRLYLADNSRFLNMTEREVIKYAQTPVSKLYHKRAPGKQLEINNRVILPGGHECTLQSPPSEEDIRKAFDIVNQAAKSGDSFSLDEAPTLDIFLREILTEKHLITIKCKQNIIGIAFLGKSHLTRSTDSPSGHIFLYLTPEFRRRSYGSTILPLLEKHAMQCGYLGALVDLLVTPEIPYPFLRKNGYSPIATVPFSGYVKSQGWTDALVFYKHFKGAKLLSHLQICNRL